MELQVDGHERKLVVLLRPHLPLRTSIAAAGLVTAQKFDWTAIGRRYADEVYRPLMKAME